MLINVSGRTRTGVLPVFLSTSISKVKFYFKMGYYYQVSLGNARLNKMTLLAVDLLNQRVIFPISVT